MLRHSQTLLVGQIKRFDIIFEHFVLERSPVGSRHAHTLDMGRPVFVRPEAKILVDPRFCHHANLALPARVLRLSAETLVRAFYGINLRICHAMCFRMHTPLAAPTTAVLSGIGLCTQTRISCRRVADNATQLDCDRSALEHILVEHLGFRNERLQKRCKTRWFRVAMVHPDDKNTPCAIGRINLCQYQPNTISTALAEWETIDVDVQRQGAR